jgi:hypothetical protein
MDVLRAFAHAADVRGAQAHVYVVDIEGDGDAHAGCVKEIEHGFVASSFASHGSGLLEAHRPFDG